MIATQGSDIGQVGFPSALAVDRAGNLYVADQGNHPALKYTPVPDGHVAQWAHCWRLMGKQGEQWY